MTGSAVLGAAGGSGGGGGRDGLLGEGSSSRSPMRMRRVVSEGDADARELRGPEGGLRLPYGTDVERGAAPGAQSADGGAGSEGGGVRRAKSRWKWLRGVLLGAEQ